jgi:hypothetical protein
MVQTFAPDTPILLETDVVVAGGGPAGIGAAVAASRKGVRVVLAESYGFLGGNWTAGLVTEFIWDEDRRPGLALEIVNRLLKKGGALKREGNLPWVKFAPEAMKYVLDELTCEAGVRLLLHAPIIGTLVEGKTVRGVIVGTKAGPRTIRSKVTIDATGDGDAAAFAGAPFEIGRASDGGTSAPTLMFRMGNVDVERVLAAVHQDKEVDGTDLKHVRQRYRRGEPIRVYELSENMLRIAREKGVVPTPEQEPYLFSPRHPDDFFTLPLPGVVVVNMAEIPNVDMADPLQLSDSEIYGRKQIWVLVDFLKQNMPGFENAFLLDTGPIWASVKRAASSATTWSPKTTVLGDASSRTECFASVPLWTFITPTAARRPSAARRGSRSRCPIGPCCRAGSTVS